MPELFYVYELRGTRRYYFGFDGDGFFWDTSTVRGSAMERSTATLWLFVLHLQSLENYGMEAA